MSKSEHGGFLHTSGARRGRTLLDNVLQTTREFPLTVDGLFGNAGNNSGVRHIESRDPIATSHKFYGLLTDGGETLRQTTTMTIKKMSDGAIVTWRLVSSSDGSPAVDINMSRVVGGVVRTHKIHFIKERQS